MLFGDKFQHYITETVKTSQKSEKLFKLMSKGKLQPFRRGPPTQKNCSEGVESAFRKDQVHIAELHQPAFTDEGLQVKSSSEKETFLQHSSRIDPTGEDTFCSNRVIFTRDAAKSEVGRHIHNIY